MAQPIIRHRESATTAAALEAPPLGKKLDLDLPPRPHVVELAGVAAEMADASSSGSRPQRRLRIETTTATARSAR
jgi:hypothetical protein